MSLQVIIEIASFLAMRKYPFYRQSDSDRHCEERSNLCTLLYNN